MPSGADLEYARMLAASGQSSGLGLDGARLEQMKDSKDAGLPYAPGPKVVPPQGFSLNGLTIPNIHRLGSGRFYADIDIKSLRPPVGTTYYVYPDAVLGSGNTGLSASSPIRLDEAQQKPDVGTIIFAPGEYPRTHVSFAGTTKSINYLASKPGVKLTGWNNPLSTTWAVHAGNVYVTSRSATLGVVDVTNKTVWGDYTVYEKKADAASITGPGQWATVGSNVYVWAIGNTNLTVSGNRTQLRLSVSSQTGINSIAGVSYIRGIEFEGFNNTSGLVSAVNSLVIVEDCSFKYGMGTNGVNVNSGRGAILVRCLASSNELDGFNYHGTNTVTPDFIEIDCVSHHNGLASPGTNNASTAHESVKGIRVNGDYDVSGGPVVADVNNAKSWNLGCRAGHSTVALSGTSWRVDSTGYESDPAQMWLDECTSDTAPVALRPTGAGAAIHLHAFKYKNEAATYSTDVDVIDYYEGIR